MRIIGYGLMALALFFYVKTIQAIWTLVAESRRLESGVRLSRIWWLPAWRVHRKAYPESSTRRRIAQFFTITFVLMLAGMGLIARSILQSSPHAF